MKLFLVCLLAVVTLTARAQECDPQQAIAAIVLGEAEFFQLGQEENTRAAFLSFLADDGIVFQPGPMNGKKAWTARPQAGLSLKWKPSFAVMSRSCDLGFTTGPSEWRKNKEDEKPLGHGQSVSIWKMQKDGAWKVAVDVGGGVPGAQKIEGPPELSINETAPTKMDQAAALKKLRAAESWLNTTAKTDSTGAIIGASSPNIRVHREGVFPAVGRNPAALMLSVLRGELSLERIGGDMSKAADLAYSYGKYSFVRPEATERGHYLQIWRTDEKGEWKLALDFQSPNQPEEKKPAS